MLISRINKLTEKLKEKIKFFPIMIFSIIMGLSGLTIVFYRAYHLQWLSKYFYLFMLFFTFMLFLLFLFLYSLKIIYFFSEVEKEFFHPVKINFFSTISISFILLSISFYSYWPILSVPLWYIGLFLHTYFTFITISSWVQNEFELHYMNPSWFIPVVGNILIPIIGVDIISNELMIFYFIIGIFFWIALFAIILYRVIFHHPLAERFIPTLFIIIAPPAVGFISYMRLFLSYDIFSVGMIFIGYFFMISLIFMIKSFLKLKFFISWWAYTFPISALSIASMIAYQISKYLIFKNFSIILISVNIIILLIVFYLTIIHMLKGEICVEE